MSPARATVREIFIRFLLRSSLVTPSEDEKWSLALPISFVNGVVSSFSCRCGSSTGGHPASGDLPASLLVSGERRRAGSVLQYPGGEGLISSDVLPRGMARSQMITTGPVSKPLGKDRTPNLMASAHSARGSRQEVVRGRAAGDSAPGSPESASSLRSAVQISLTPALWQIAARRASCTRGPPP